MINRSIYTLIALCFMSMSSIVNGCIETVAVRIDSLPCHFCFPAIAKKLLGLKSIKHVSFSEASNTVHITLMDKNAFNPYLLTQVIEEGTMYKIKDIKVTATGKVVKRGHHLLLEMESSPRYFYLDKVPEAMPKKDYDINAHKHEKKKKDERGFFAKSRRAFEKTNDFVRNLLSMHSKNQSLLMQYAQNEMPVRVSGSLHSHVDHSMWCIGANVQIKEVTTPRSM